MQAKKVFEKRGSVCQSEAMEGGSLGQNRIVEYLTSNNYYSFMSPYLMKYESLIQRFSGNYRGTIVLYDLSSLMDS